jgi:hypothetical protein
MSASPLMFMCASALRSMCERARLLPSRLHDSTRTLSHTPRTHMHTHTCSGKATALDLLERGRYSPSFSAPNVRPFDKVSPIHIYLRICAEKEVIWRTLTASPSGLDLVAGGQRGCSKRMSYKHHVLYQHVL